MMITDLIVMMTILTLNYADYCDFELTKYENILFSSFTPFILNCAPVYNDPDMCNNHPPYKWTFQNKEIRPKEGKIKLIPSSQKLIVFNGSKTDEGIYICNTMNNRNSTSTTFNVRMTNHSMMQKSLLPNSFPNDPLKEMEGRIYWLPEMLLKDVQQRIVSNSGSNIQLHGCYYISAEETQILSFDVQWYYYIRDVNESISENLRNKVKTFNSSCNDLDFLPRLVNGSCYNSRLHLDNLIIKDQGYYVSAAKLQLKNGVTHSLNFTYELSINIANIFELDKKSENPPQMTFNNDGKVCTSDHFDWNCKVSESTSYIITVYKVNHNFNYTALAMSELRKINFTNENGEIDRNGMYVKNHQVNYHIKSVKKTDAGLYECRAYHINDLRLDIRNRLEVVETMKLTVNDCIGKPEYTMILWPVVSVCAVILIIILATVIYRLYINYSGSYLIKTVIVQHPNKLYVPHDTCFPLIMPDVTIKTIHKHMNSSEDSLLQQKHFNRISNVPFSQKISKYLRKSFIFSYRHVDISGSNPESPIGVLSNAETNKMTSNSLTVEAPRPQLILQNDAHTKYILPSNIGWIFSRESLMIGSKIGEGAFGIVYSAFVKSFSDNSAPVEVAIKTLHTSFGDEDVINLIQELEMMKMIGQHRHIISLYGACVDNGHPYMVIELAKHGNLRDFLRARRSQSKTGDIQNCLGLVVTQLTVADLLRFSLEIAKGMEYLSSRMIIHRDLAARNVLVDQYLEMKIADFGLTRAVEHYYRKTTDGRLPIKWMAPECLLERVYTVKSDVWSFGIVLWEIFTMGQTPYPTIQSDAMHQALRNGIRNEKPSLASDEMYRLMLTTWNDDPQDRHSFTELVDKLTHIQLLEGGISQKRDYLEISSNQCYSTTIV